MCTLLFAIDQHPKYKFVLAANRDEFLKRKTAPLHWWDDLPEIIGGRDLEAGGTWMAMNKGGRFAALTNYREFPIPHEQAPSRGALVTDFLRSTDGALSYNNHLQNTGAQYNGFNLIFSEADQWHYYSNRAKQSQIIDAGLYGISNALLDDPWPKVQKGKRELAKLLRNPNPEIESFFPMLADRTIHPDELLPSTGVSLEWERQLSPIKIETENYGTRVSTVILIDRENNVSYAERTFATNKDEHFQFVAG